MKLLSSTSFQSESSLVTWPEYSALIRKNGLISFCSKTTRALVGFCSKTWTRDALKVDNTGFFDKTCLGFRSRYMWRIMHGNQLFFLKWCLSDLQMNSSYIRIYTVYIYIYIYICMYICIYTYSIYNEYLFHLYSSEKQKVAWFWNDMRVNKWWQNFHFSVNYPFKWWVASQILKTCTFHSHSQSAVATSCVHNKHTHKTELWLVWHLSQWGIWLISAEYSASWVNGKEIHLHNWIS